ncbi:MAG: heparin lyase I family protein [Steroidobacteraceae bacterium]
MREVTSAVPGNRCRPRALILIAGALLVQSAYPQIADIRKDSFETGAIQTSLWNASDTDGCSISVQTGGAAEGKHYMRSTLTSKEGGGNYRCELNGKGMGPSGFDGITLYYGISYRIPAATQYDAEVGDTLTQWFQNPNTGGGGCHQVVQIKDKVLQWHNHNCGGVGGGDVTLLSPVPKDTWVRVCKKAKWTTNDDGEIKVWVNPTSESSSPVKSYSGQTLIDEYTQIVKFKIGNYKPTWRTVHPPPNMAAMSPRIFDIDDVRVGASFADACGAGSVAPIPIPKPPISVAVE